MMGVTKILYSILSVFFVVATVSANGEFKGHLGVCVTLPYKKKRDKVYRITPKTVDEVIFLKQWIEKSQQKLDVWKDVSQPGRDVDVHVTKNDCNGVEAMLKTQGVQFKEMIHDVEELIKEEQVSKNMFTMTMSGYDYEAYHDYNAILKELKTLATIYQKKTAIFSVGRSYEGREMIGLKITNGDGKFKPVHWINGGIHAREWISPATVMYFIRKLLTSSDASVQQVLDKNDFQFLPVLNVDGYAFTHNKSSNRFWRKTRSRQPSGSTCIGADPNRNWDRHFAGAGTSSDPCSNVYHGRFAFSEIEVSNVATHLANIRGLKSYWDVHAYSQLVLTPWSDTTTLAPDYTEIKRGEFLYLLRHDKHPPFYCVIIAKRVADVFVDAVRKRYKTKYVAGPPTVLLYAVSGGSIDWTYAALDIKYSYAPELRDTGKYGFVLPANQIKPSGEETSDAFLAAILAMK